MDTDSLGWGRVYHEEGIGPEGPIDKTTMKAESSVWYHLYLRERRHSTQERRHGSLSGMKPKHYWEIWKNRYQLATA